MSSDETSILQVLTNLLSYWKAGEVVLLILEALKNNDNPTPNKGIEILFGYSSSSSQIMNEEGLTHNEYAEFLKETEYKVLFDHEEVVSTQSKQRTLQMLFFRVLSYFKWHLVNAIAADVVQMIDKGKYAFDGKKAFLTARLRVGPGPKDFTSCNFILTRFSTDSTNDDDEDAWLVESMLIRPESMRRRRRR